MNKRIEHLVVEYLDGDLDEAGARELAEWLESSGTEQRADREEFAELARQARALAVLAELQRSADGTRFVQDVMKRLPGDEPAAVGADGPLSGRDGGARDGHVLDEDVPGRPANPPGLSMVRRRGGTRLRRARVSRVGALGPRLALAAVVLVAAGLFLLVLGPGSGTKVSSPQRQVTARRSPREMPPTEAQTEAQIRTPQPVTPRVVAVDEPLHPQHDAETAREGVPTAQPAEGASPRETRRGRVRPRVASITVPEGTLEFAPAGTDRWAEAREDMWLAPGDWLRTREAPARVVFDSGTVLYANSYTTLMLLTEERPGRPDNPPGLSMVSGEVYVETLPRFDGADSGFHIHTPHGRAVDIGTRFDVRVEPERTTVMVVEGVVEASTDAGAVALRAEQEVVLARLASPPGEVRPALDIDRRLAWTKAFDERRVVGTTSWTRLRREPEEPVLKVTGFTLIDADTDRPIARFDPIPDGATIDLARLPTRRLNIRANVVPPMVGSVRFDLGGPRRAESSRRAVTVEEFAPYSLYGDTEGDYKAWTPGEGTHTLTATPYSGFKATGREGASCTITFHVTGGGEGRR